MMLPWMSMMSDDSDEWDKHKMYRETASKQTSEDCPFQFCAGSCSAHPAKHRHFRCSTEAARLYNGNAAPGQQMHRNSQASPQSDYPKLVNWAQLLSKYQTSNKRFSTSNERESTDQLCCVSSETFCMLPFSDCGIGMWIGLHVHKFLFGIPQEVSEDAMRRHAMKKSEVSKASEPYVRPPKQNEKNVQQAFCDKVVRPCRTIHG